MPDCASHRAVPTPDATPPAAPPAADPPAPSRRTVLRGGLTAGAAVGLAAVAGPALGTLSAPPAQAAGAVFPHGVASGDPLGDAVVLWTRVTPTPSATPGSGLGPAVDVGWEVAADPAFRTVLRRGSVRTDAGRDHTVSVDVRGLRPYTRYWYRFSALGQTSPVGRTQTAGTDAVHALRLAFVSCSNWTGGYFRAYRYVAERDDLDVVVHLGDYFYEYGNGADRYGPPELAGRRDHVPGYDPVSLADYRQRHGQYKTDPDLQAAHAAHPWIVVFDDHEVADNSYDTGAVNHDPATQGPYAVRRAHAYQAYLEWMPIRLPDQGVPHRGTRFWRSFSFGPLADLFVLETRQNRSKQVAQTELQALGSPDRVLPEPEQMAALKAQVAGTGVRWHLLANQVVFAPVVVSPQVPDAGRLAPLGLFPSVGNVRFNPDQWDGYQDDQRELLAALAASPVDTVVLTGDIHSSWANELPLDPATYLPAPGRPLNNSVGVEFVCPSVTSDGFTEVLGSPQAAVATTTALQVANPWIKYLDGVGHGFAVLDVTPERVQSDFFFVTDRTDPAAVSSFAAAWQSVRGSRRLTAAAGPVGARSDRPRTEPAVTPTPSASASPAGPAAAARASGQRGVLAATGGAPPAAAALLLAAGAAGLRLRRRRPAGATTDGPA